MWVDVAIVALLLGACAILKRADWHTRFLTRIRAAGSSWVKAAHDAVTDVRLKRVRPPGQPPSTGKFLPAWRHCRDGSLPATEPRAVQRQS